MDTKYARFDTLEEFAEFYRAEVVPTLRTDPSIDVDPERETPPYRWLKGNYSGFVERLRRDYDLSPGDFYDAVGLPDHDGNEDDNPWGLGHDPTVRSLEDYLEELERDRGRAETTVGPRRSRLRTFVTTYKGVNETDDLLTPLLDETAKPDEIARVRDTFRVLDERLGTLASKKKYASAVRNWYTFLVEMGRSLYNPAENIVNRFGWDEEPIYDHPALSRDDLDAMLAAGDDAERFLLLALAGWGLRPVEACELHTSQLVLDPDGGDVPYVEFAVGERKNARRMRNTVELLVGVDATRTRIDSLGEHEGWTGYFLPGQSIDRPLSTQTARRWFRDLGERAGVDVDGSHPLPKMGRRTWYRLYRQQRPDIDAGTAAVAASQGSRDATVSERNYLDERTRRRTRANAMRNLVEVELASIFDRYL
jgi:site-specific recombinase XerD